MKIVLAPDKFKGSLSAAEVAAAMARGLRRCLPDARVVEMPIADGGEGTMALIVGALGAARYEVEVVGPVGDPVLAGYGISGETALMEMSAASGLMLVGAAERDPWRATTFGTGEMIADALSKGVRELIIGIGGSATNDGGIGMAQALGYECVFEQGGRLAAIRPPAMRPGEQAEFVAACDVTNPLLGRDGCTQVFGRQKGICQEDFCRHEARLARLAEVVNRDVAAVSADTPGAGAAGGLGFGLMAFCGARLRPGFDLVAEVTGLEEMIASADLVITGEGSMDAQTLMGKGPVGVADLARAAGKRVVAFCGVASEASSLLTRFDAVVSLQGLAASPEDSMERAGEILEDAVAGALEILSPVAPGARKW